MEEQRKGGLEAMYMLAALAMGDRSSCNRPIGVCTKQLVRRPEFRGSIHTWVPTQVRTAWSSGSRAGKAGPFNDLYRALSAKPHGLQLGI